MSAWDVSVFSRLGYPSFARMVTADIAIQVKSTLTVAFAIRFFLQVWSYRASTGAPSPASSESSRSMTWVLSFISISPFRKASLSANVDNINQTRIPVNRFERGNCKMWKEISWTIVLSKVFYGVFI